MFKLFFSLTLLEIIVSSPSCMKNENFCIKCDITGDLCFKCQNDVLVPDDKGGCVGIKKCIFGRNYCEKCDENENICKSCSIGYYPDENGACSYTENCAISFHGECLVCKNDFILIGNEKLKLCKPMKSEDFTNCEKINFNNGYCETCKESFYLNEGDKKCINIEHCSESIFGQCISCASGYFIDYKEKNKCKSQEENKNFLYCKETEDGENCSKCEDGYYFDSNNKCVNTNYCLLSYNFKCSKCTEGYYLSGDRDSCTNDENCYSGDKDFGICNWCKLNFYLDTNDKKCKPNTEEDDDLMYCKYYEDKCISCESGYELGEDNKCTKTKNCAIAKNGICTKCSNDYYLGLDNKCTNVTHCIYSNYYYVCEECEDGYYYDKYEEVCKESSSEYFTNCKSSDWDGISCAECKNDFYLLNSDKKCYDNKIKGKYYKCAYVDNENGNCNKCINGYYLGKVDKICSGVKGCIKSNDDKCIECDTFLCLDVKKGTCENNYFIENEEGKKYFGCKKTNEEGDRCEICEEEKTLGNKGFCIDTIHCEEEKDGICVKCINDDSSGLFYCLNHDYSCIETDLSNCMKCDDEFNLEKCTECLEGYELSEDLDCI